MNFPFSWLLSTYHQLCLGCLLNNHVFIFLSRGKWALLTFLFYLQINKRFSKAAQVDEKYVHYVVYILGTYRIAHFCKYI